MNFISKIIDSIYNVFGESFLRPWFVVFLCMLIVGGVYLFLSEKLDKLCQSVEEKISYKYDNIFYLWSIFYNKHTDKLNSNPGLIVLKSIRKSGKSKYVSNRFAIKKTIRKIENKLGTKVIPENERKELSKLYRKYDTRKLLSNSVKLILSLILILGFMILISIIFNRNI